MTTTNQTIMKKRHLSDSFSPSTKRVKMSINDDLVDILDPKMELEKKRQASRESSRRTRERERSRVDYFKANKLRLEGDNEKIRAENERLRRLIQLIKEGTAKKYSSTMATMATPQPLPVPPKIAAPTVTQQPPQLQQMLLMSLLSNSLVANQTQATQKPVMAPAPTSATNTVDQSQLLSILSSLTSIAGKNTFQAPTGGLIPLYQGAQ